MGDLETKTAQCINNIVRFFVIKNADYQFIGMFLPPGTGGAPLVTKSGDSILMSIS